MASKTQSYRNQQRELLRLTGTIPSEAAQIDARAARRSLDELRSLFVVHVRLQAGMLYPSLQRDGSPALKQRANDFSRLAGAIVPDVLKLSDAWKSTDAIAADPHGFANAWRVVRGRLHDLLVAEERELYDAIDVEAALPV